MKIYIVNLDRDTGKFEKVAVRLRELGVQFDRCPAVLGSALSDGEKAESIKAFRVWCAIGRRLEDGELGCALSHLKIYRKMIEDNVDIACVLEDDVILDSRFPEQTMLTGKFLACVSPRVVLLSNRGNTKGPDWSFSRTSSDWGTFGYMLNLSAAKAILKANYPVQRPSDHWWRWVSAGIIELYHAYPTVCDYDHSYESQTATRRRVSDYNIIHWGLHKFKRLIGKTFDKILPL